MSPEHFCTCTDLNCPLHPKNHDKGCDLCIQKNLRMKEIPSCFFKAVDSDTSGVDDFSFEGFARFLQERKKD